MFHRSYSGGAVSWYDLSSVGKRSLYSAESAGTGFRCTSADVYKCVSCIYERNCSISFSDYFILWSVSDYLASSSCKKSVENTDGSCIHLYWTGAFPDRCKCGLYACRYLSWQCDCRRKISLSSDSGWNGDRFFYC